MAEAAGSAWMKRLITAIFLIDVACGAVVGWFWLFELPDVRTELTRSQRTVASLKRDVLEYVEDVSMIIRDGYKETLQPETYIQDQLLVAGIDPALLRVMPGRIGGVRGMENLQEIVWEVQNRAKNQLYPLGMILAACEAIEKGNPKLKIREVDLGTREAGFEKDAWSFDKLLVRKFQLRESGRRR